MNYTTVEQSKKLLELGLNPETADMWWTPLNWQLTEYYVEVKQDGIGTPKNPIPCWSLGALMELMPKIKEDEDDGGCYPTLCKGYNTNKWHCVEFINLFIENFSIFFGDELYLFKLFLTSYIRYLIIISLIYHHP